MVFTPKFPQTCQQKQDVKWWELLEKVEQCGRWPQQACTTMFFLIPKNVTSERPIALLPALIRWWEGLRAPEVTRWQQRHRFRCDASDGRNGGAVRTVWETLLEMERFDFHAGETRPTSAHMCLRVGLSFGSRWPASPVGLGDACQISLEESVCAVR